MTDTTPSRILSDYGSPADTVALANRIFDGRATQAYEEQDEFLKYGVIDRKTMSGGGKSHQYIIYGNAPASGRHTPGEFFDGNKIRNDDVVITVEDRIANSARIDIADLNVSEFEIIGNTARRLAERNANEISRNIAICGIQAARTAAVTVDSVTIHNGGNRVTRDLASGTTLASYYPNTTTGASNFIDDVAQLAQLMDEDFVPQTDRHLFIDTYIARILRNELSIYDADLSSTPNRLNERRVPILEGFMVHVTTQLPSTTVSGTPAKYDGNYTATQAASETYGLPAALAMCGASQGMAAVGMVDYGQRNVVTFDENRDGYLCKATWHQGLGVLHPWCAGEICGRVVT